MQQVDDVRRVGGGECVGLGEMAADRDADGDALMIAARRSASSAGMAWAICAW